MQTQARVCHPALFLLFATQHPEAWDDLVGQQVVHQVLKRGTITEIRTTAQSEKRIIVQFDDLPSGAAIKQFPSEALREYFTELTIPPTLEGFEAFRAKHLEDQRRKEAQERAAAEFAALKVKYHAAKYADSSPRSPLHSILLQLDRQERLSLEDVAWLGQQRLYGVLGHFYEQEAERTGDKWNLVKAGSYWRKAEHAERALHIVDGVHADDPRLMSALLTVQGAALRDLQRLQEAEQRALAAIARCPTSHYPYALLGAICFETGRPGEGDRYFQQAEELGVLAHETEAKLQESLGRAGAAERRRTAEYLLKKDPRRYHWANRYLR